MAADHNVSGLRGGNEGQACVLLRPVSAPCLHADMGRLAPALLACLRPVNAGEACNRLGGVGETTRTVLSGPNATRTGALNSLSAMMVSFRRIVADDGATAGRSRHQAACDEMVKEALTT